MATRIKRHATSKSRGQTAAKEVIGRVGDGWRVLKESGETVVIRSSKSSNAVMDRAMTKYDGALRRLANR